MKKLIFALLTLTLFSFVGDTEKYPTITIGTKAPLVDLKMDDISGSSYALNDIKAKNGICVIFSCNTCPFVVGRGDDNEGWEGRYNQIAELCKKDEIGIVFVNSNEAKREGDDSMEAMKNHAKENNYSFTYVADKDSKLANAFGAKSTPHVFLFNNELTLAYEGAIDDNNASAAKAEKHYLQDAISNLASGKPIDPNNTKALGCSIKRK